MGSARLPLHRDQETAFPEWLNRQQINASVTLLTNTSILPPRARAVGVPAQTYFPVLRTHHAATSIARGLAGLKLAGVQWRQRGRFPAPAGEAAASPARGRSRLGAARAQGDANVPSETIPDYREAMRSH